MIGAQSLTGQHPPPAAEQARLSDYLSLARFDHITKHVFILPGLALAMALRPWQAEPLLANLGIGLLSAICIASANYVINEWLDRSFDASHPTKSKRRAVVVAMRPAIVYGEYALLSVAGLVLGYLVGSTFFVVSVCFLLSGVVYNVPPLRLKDKAYLDVLTECLNNPIRLLLGWSMVDGGTLPPVSILLAYWTAGAFLMAAKRLGEYRDLVATVGVEVLGRYRRSFYQYTQESLLVSCFVYAMITAFLLGVFLVKYRPEYVLVFPAVSGLFGVYLWLATRQNSVVQRPERLFHSRRLNVMLALCVVTFIVCTFVDIPALDFVATPSLVTLSP